MLVIAYTSKIKIYFISSMPICCKKNNEPRRQQIIIFRSKIYQAKVTFLIRLYQSAIKKRKKKKIFTD